MSQAAPTPRQEPLLWLQLLGFGVLPLEALLLLLVLGAGDPGPFPALERLLAWGIGSLATAFLLWRRPADIWSLLLVQVPARGRRDGQNRLSSLLPPPLVRVATALLACLLSLVLLWWCDGHAAVAIAFSPLAESPRLLGLLLAAVLLAVLQWQAQQLVQALWLLSRAPSVIAEATPFSPADLERERLSLGLPLLLLPSLRAEAVASPSPPAPAPPRRPVAAPGVPPDPDQTGGADHAEPLPEPSSGAVIEPSAAADTGPPRSDPAVELPPLGEAEGLDQNRLAGTDGSELPIDPIPSQPLDEDGLRELDPEARGVSDPSVAGGALAVEPEQPAEDEEGGTLDEQVI